MAAEPQHDSKVDMFVRGTEKFALGQEREVLIDVRNVSEEAQPAGWLRVSGGGVWMGSLVAVPALEPQETVTVAAAQLPLHTPTMRNFEAFVSLRYSAADTGVLIGEYTVAFDNHGVRRSLRAAHPWVTMDATTGKPRAVQLQLLGFMGCGKTSTLSTIHSVVQRRNGFALVARTGNGIDTHTRDVHTYVLAELNMHLSDAYGLENGQWSAEQLRWLMEGVLPHKINMDAVNALGPEELAKLRSSASPRRRDAVIFCVPATLLAGQALDGNDELELSRQAFTAVRDTMPLIVVTKTDECIAGLSAATFDDEQFAEPLAALTRRVAVAFGVEPRRVHPLMNYQTETERSGALDGAVLRLLEAATEVADARAEQCARLTATFGSGPWTGATWSWRSLATATATATTA